MDSRSMNLHQSLLDDLSKALPTSGEVLPPTLREAVRSYACENLKRTLLKKLKPKETSEADKAALEKFKRKNSECASWVWSPTCPRDEVLLNTVKGIIESYFFSGPDMHLTYTEICAGFDQGPGAAIGAPENDFYNKLFNSKLSYTSSSLYELYVEAVRNNPAWFEAESNRRHHLGVQTVDGSRLTFVPKYADISRVICVEPILNMAFQKGISTVLKSCLKRRTGIDFSVQPKRNSELARIGSESGSFATIDLESASDSISTNLVRELFPRHVVRWLEFARSPCTTIPKKYGGEVVELHMISSMGNDYTFPLQTMIFSAIVLAAYKVHGIKPVNPRDSKVPSTGMRNSLKNGLTLDPGPLIDELDRRYVGKERLGNWGVFGDDIICRREAYDTVVHLLTLFGFTVNELKSFNTGLFRESCGTDWFCGQNVRGVYIQALDTEHDVYSAINRLVRWGVRHDVLLPRTIAYLAEKVKFLPIPLEEQDIHGIKLPYEVASLGRSTLRNGTGHTLYRIWSVRSRSYDVHDPVRVSKLRGWRENPAGLFVSALAGRLRDGRITPRLQSKSARCKVVSSFCWDWFPTARTERSEFHATYIHHSWIYFASASQDAADIRRSVEWGNHCRRLQRRGKSAGRKKANPLVPRKPGS